LRPELASFDAGSINMGAGVFLNPPEFHELLAARALETGVKLEIECFEAGMVSTAVSYRERGLLRPPLHFQFVLGTPFGMPATAKSLLHLVESAPAGATWSVAGMGRSQLPMALLGMVMGGHVRVGLEDNVFFSKGVLARSSAELVARVVRIAGELGRGVASCAQARELLSLPA
jgi:3-keto-5-aminohexanoate cleavage enzyme